MQAGARGGDVNSLIDDADLPIQFRTQVRVEFCDTDMAGIVHFANFYLYMERAEGEFFRSIGLDLVTRNTDGSAVGWPRVSTGCSFKAPAYFGDILTVEISVFRIGVKSLTMRFTFKRGDTLIAIGRVKSAYCRFRANAPIESLEIPAEWVARIENSRAETR